MSSKNKIVLTSSDGESFEIDEAVARKSQIVSNMIDDDCADKPIPIVNVTGKILALVIEYCKKHVDDDSDSTRERVNDEAKKDLVTWDAEFMKDIDMATVFSLILAANYLNIKSLLDFTCQHVADHIKDMMPEEIRTIFNIENDFTPEEEAAVRKENEWAFN